MVARISLSVVVLASVVFAAGCPSRPAKPKVAVEKKKDSPPEKGPRGGALVEWGDEEYHLEFLVDRGKKQATVYVLDEVAARPSPISAEVVTLTLSHTKPPLQIPMKADPDKSDPPGRSSKFVAVHDDFGKVVDFKGEISGKIGSALYRGELGEK